MFTLLVSGVAGSLDAGLYTTKEGGRGTDTVYIGKGTAGGTNSPDGTVHLIVNVSSWVS